jgi:hypothetical protein
VLEEAQASIPEFAASFEAFRLSGAGVLRHGARPALGLGLTMDRLDLARWLPRGLDPGAAARALGAIDVNLRLAAERATHGEVVLERAAIDAAAEAGRITLRRLSGRVAETDVVAAGVAVLAPQFRLQDVSLEANGPALFGLAALIPGGWPDGMAITRQAVSLRLSGSGPLEALALRGGAELGELRLEGSGTLDALARRFTASLTLRHPGAPRLIAEALGSGAGSWLGEGSFSLVASLAGGAGAWSAESFELVAGTLRARGALSLAPGQGGRPRLAGRLAAERLPLPAPGWRSPEPLGFAALAGFDAELALEAAQVEAGSLLLEGASAALRLEQGRLQLDALRGRIAGGTLEMAAGLDIEALGPPVLSVEGRLADATIAAPLFGLPFDLSAGRGDLTFALTAAGHSPRALLGTLDGTWSASFRDGVLTGFDLAAVAAASAGDDARGAEPVIRRALVTGATAFDRLELEGRAEAGRLVLATGRVTTDGGATATLAGEADLPRGTLDLRLATRPPLPEAPDLGLRVTGPAAEPRALPETSAWARWRAERG